MKLAIGSDHGGFELKDNIRRLLDELGHETVDCGCYSPDSVDYPDFASEVCMKVQDGEVERGILICGTGIGMSMAANRHKNIRAALCHEQFTARMSREHNNANVLCMGARVVGPSIAEEIVKTWVASEFTGGRHQRRIEMFSG